MQTRYSLVFNAVLLLGDISLHLEDLSAYGIAVSPIEILILLASLDLNYRAQGRGKISFEEGSSLVTHSTQSSEESPVYCAVTFTKEHGEVDVRKALCSA
ncbi:hypothetical protein AAES_103404 [Amazona aestiva]|uniref:Uncharacterized protein n=1 Tax=Amazona aestiva TaxID=12930 RepID=A0A0Q3US81_AMAAE|nr:hypothetical protein AAES_103404 [Amazona aestiva]